MAALAEVVAGAAEFEHSGARRRWYRIPTLMAGLTILGLILTPAFYVMTRKLTKHLPQVRLPWRRRVAPAE